MITFKQRRLIWTNPWIFIACGFGIGTLPLVPGTFATLASVPFYLVLAQLPLFYYLLALLLFNAVGIWLCGKANSAFGTKDHPAAVWDEIASFPIVMTGIPATWYFIVIGVLLFRAFDILKPGPIGWIDKKVPGGLGVMLDDIVAALFAWILLKIITLLF